MGVDIAKYTYATRAIDDQGIEISKKFSKYLRRLFRFRTVDL